MADFCRHALAYMTGRPLKDFRKMKTAVLGDQLLHHLKARPWLLILDGLERLLVAYHRFDAAQIADEDAGTTGQISDRNPFAAIRPEDDDLLRALVGAGPSKLLLTSRLTPRVLLNPASQAIPGVRLERLPGLRPADAEKLLRSCGVTGSSKDIRDYLNSHCDCHPLVTGVLAGIVNDYLPNRGNFDAWVADSAGGGKLNLADLDLVQKRNHILHAALAALPENSRQLLSTLAILSEAVDYATLNGLNPFVSSEPEGLEVLEDAEALRAGPRSPEFLAAQQELDEAVRDLERRGLLQYDTQARRYDLHPVVRGVAVGGLRQEEKDRYGQRVVDHFSQQAYSPYEDAETLDDVRNGLQVVRALLQMGRLQEASNVYMGGLNQALHYNLDAHAETLSLLRPFFPHGWATLPNDLDASFGAHLTNSAGNALFSAGDSKGALAAHGTSLLADLESADWRNVRVCLSNISEVLASQNHLAREERCILLALDLASLRHNKEDLFRARLDRFAQLAGIGQWTDAKAIWQLLDPMGRRWIRAIYRSGRAEKEYAFFRFWQGDLGEERLADAERLARSGKDRTVIRYLHHLRGEWQLDRRQYALAAESLHEAVRMAREVGQTAPEAETQLVLARLHLGELSDPRHGAEQLARASQPSHRALAHLWLAIGDRERAKEHALAAYKWAWADGEPYVRRYSLNKARALLEQLDTETPRLPPYDRAKDEKLPWEDEVVAAIEKLRAEKTAEETEEE